MAKAGDADTGKAENGVSQDAPILSQSDIGQSPILTVIRKRLRAANKRLKRIEEIEGARAAGKTLDADQVDSQWPPPCRCMRLLVLKTLLAYFMSTCVLECWTGGSVACEARCLSRLISCSNTCQGLPVLAHQALLLLSFNSVLLTHD